MGAHRFHRKKQPETFVTRAFYSVHPAAAAERFVLNSRIIHVIFLPATHSRCRYIAFRPSVSHGGKNQKRKHNAVQSVNCVRHDNMMSRKSYPVDIVLRSVSGETFSKRIPNDKTP